MAQHFFKQQHWKRIREQVVKDHPSKARQSWTQIRNKWDKLKRRYYKEKKLHNVMGDNVGSQWIWFNMIDEVLSGTAKAHGVSGGVDNGQNVDVEDQPQSQQREGT